MLNLKPHIRAKTKEGAIISKNPYMRISQKDQSSVFLQAGKAYASGGTLIHKIPEWAEAIMGNMSKKALKEVGY